MRFPKIRSACMAVVTVVIDDLSYDRQWTNSPQLYRIVTVNKMGDGLYDRFAGSFTGVNTRLAADYPEVKAVGSLANRPDRFRLDPHAWSVLAVRSHTTWNCTLVVTLGTLTYALRACSGALLAVPNPAPASGAQDAVGGGRWLLMVFRHMSADTSKARLASGQVDIVHWLEDTNG